LALVLMMGLMTVAYATGNAENGDSDDAELPGNISLGGEGMWYENPYERYGVASSGDMVLLRSPAAEDDQNGNITVRLLLSYKDIPVTPDAKMNMFSIEPYIENPSEYPFQITWTSYAQNIGDLVEYKNTQWDTERGYGIGRYCFEFHFKTKDDLYNSTYGIPFRVRYLHFTQDPLTEQPAEVLLTAFVNVTHGKPKETPTPSPTPEPAATPTPQARVILKESRMNPADVVGGDSFDLTLVLENTHANMTVRNMKCAIGDDLGTVMPESGSNSFYIESIAPQSTHEVTLRMKSLPSAGIEPVKMKLSMNYVDRNAERQDTEEFTLPIHQVVKLTVDEPSVPSEAYADEQFYLTLKFYNTGKASMYNTLVSMESDTMVADETMFVGTLDGGKQATYEVMVQVPSSNLPMGDMGMEDMPMDDVPLDKMPVDDAPVEIDAVGSVVFGGYYASAVVAVDGKMMMDDGDVDGGMGGTVCEGNIVIAYEDVDQVQYRKEIPITVTIRTYDDMSGGYDPFAGLDYDYDTGYYIDRVTGDMIDPVTMMPVERGVNPWIVIGICAGAVVVAVVALLIILRVRKKRRLRKEQELEMNLELEQDLLSSGNAADLEAGSGHEVE
jgi:hypothetical protein